MCTMHKHLVFIRASCIEPRNLPEVHCLHIYWRFCRTQHDGVEMEVDMIRTVLTFQTSAQQATELLEFYRSEKVLQTSLDHTRALASEISVNTAGRSDVMITALWPDQEAYDEWLRHPERDRFTAGLERILGDDMPRAGATYEIDHDVRRASP